MQLFMETTPAMAAPTAAFPPAAASPFSSPPTDAHAADKAAHHTALMEMIQEEGIWTAEMETALQVRKQRIMARLLEQQGQELTQQQQALGIAPITEVMPGVPIEEH